MHLIIHSLYTEQEVNMHQTVKHACLADSQWAAVLCKSLNTSKPPLAWTSIFSYSEEVNEGGTFTPLVVRSPGTSKIGHSASGWAWFGT